MVAIPLHAPRHRWPVLAIGGIAAVLGLGAVLAFSATAPRVPVLRPAAVLRPGVSTWTVATAGYRVHVRFVQKGLTSIGSTAIDVSRGGAPVAVRLVQLTTSMVEMKMGYTGLLTRSGARFVHAWPPLMVGHWQLRYLVTPLRGRPFSVRVVRRIA